LTADWSDAMTSLACFEGSGLTCLRFPLHNSLALLFSDDLGLGLNGTMRCWCRLVQYPGVSVLCACIRRDRRGMICRSHISRCVLHYHFCFCAYASTCWALHCRSSPFHRLKTHLSSESHHQNTNLVLVAGLHCWQDSTRRFSLWIWLSTFIIII
jgi:hypothetical protein